MKAYAVTADNKWFSYTSGDIYLHTDGECGAKGGMVDELDPRDLMMSPVWAEYWASNRDGEVVVFEYKEAKRYRPPEGLGWPRRGSDGKLKQTFKTDKKEGPTVLAVYSEGEE